MNRIRKGARRGISLTEVLVAATLVLSMIGILSPMTVRVGKVWQSTRQYRIALNELANQMDLLTSSGLESCQAALPNIKPSPLLVESLPGAQILGELVRDQNGTRLLLKLNWDRGLNAVPLSLVGWLDTDPVADATNAINLDALPNLHSEELDLATLARNGVQP